MYRSHGETVPEVSGGVTESATDRCTAGGGTEPRPEMGDCTGPSTVVPITPSSTVTTEMPDTVMQTMTQFLEAQTKMLAAQTQAMAAQSFPPMPHFTGEGDQSDEDSFERWMEHFEERARGWPPDQCLYQLKAHLSKTAKQAFRMLPEKDRNMTQLMDKW